MPNQFLVLHLKRKWYDLIREGAKCVEYRKIKQYWEKRLFEKSAVTCSLKQKHDWVKFVCGYSESKNTPAIFAYIDYIDIGTCPIPGWNGKYYRINFRTPRFWSRYKFAKIGNSYFILRDQTKRKDEVVSVPIMTKPIPYKPYEFEKPYVKIKTCKVFEVAAPNIDEAEKYIVENMRLRKLETNTTLKGVSM